MCRWAGNRSKGKPPLAAAIAEMGDIGREEHRPVPLQKQARLARQSRYRPRQMSQAMNLESFSPLGRQIRGDIGSKRAVHQLRPMPFALRGVPRFRESLRQYGRFRYRRHEYLFDRRAGSRDAGNLNRTGESVESWRPGNTSVPQRAELRPASASVQIVCNE